MEQWQYRILYCSTGEVKDEKGKKYRDWAITYTNGDQIVGLENILNYEGSKGWDLVNAVHEPMYPNNGYRLFFKRRV